jgi:chromosome segregation protein
VQRLQNQIAAHRSRIDFNRERSEELSALIERYESDIAAAETKLAQQESEIHDTDALLRETERLLETKKNELAQANERAGDVRRERETHDQALQALELSISKAENRIADLEEEISGTMSRQAATTPRLAELEASLGKATAARDQVTTLLEAKRAAAAEQQEALQDWTAKIPSAEEAVAREQQALREAESALLAGEHAVTERKSRLDILQQLNAEGEGLAQGSQALLKGLGDPDRILPGLTGALASLIEVEEEFIPAIEASLGRNLHAIVLRDEALAREIIAKLTDEKLGQTALIAPEWLASPPSVDATLPEGAIAWARDKVHAPAELQSLVRHLLGGVVLVHDLGQAQELKKQAPGLAFATLRGELISTQGVIYGGRVGEENSSLFARKAQIATLVTEHRNLLNAQENLRSRREEAERVLARAIEQLEEVRARQAAARSEHSATALEVSALERELHEANREADAIAWEKATLDQQLTASAGRVAQLESESSGLRDTLAQEEARRATAQAAAEAARSRDAELAEELNNLRLAVATERQRHEGLRTQRQPMTTRQAELAELIATRRADVVAYQTRREQQALETTATEEAIESENTELSVAEATVVEITGTRAVRLAEVNTLEADLRGRRKALSDLHDARGKEEVRQTQVQLKIENLSEHVMRRYQVDLGEFAPDRYAFSKTFRAQIKQRGKAEEEEAVDDTQLREIIDQLTRQLDGMGPVNLDAVHEYDELEERHTFLETQNADLTNSRRELLDVISRINQTTERLFAETFAQVRINFREMFAELFAGGRADLALLDEGDALNSGIDIIAKPPGKQLQSVSLLSGGERAMTAVALLFAIYMVRPSPFCILDEMDAPLDESNINRFIKVLDRFVAQSQFVIITHNKRTIAKADILYGVTMEERGISKLVGVRLSAAQSEATPLPAGEEAVVQQSPLQLDDAVPESAAATR